MRRERFSWLSLNRFAKVSMAALIVLMLAGSARAETITPFDVFGTAQNISGGTLGSCADQAFCSFSGTMMVDVTAGRVTGWNITFPGLAPFDNCCFAQGSGFISHLLWSALGTNSDGIQLMLDFFPPLNPPSLVGFAGGPIADANVSAPFPLHTLFYARGSGEITPVPEPSTWSLIGTGLLCCLGYGLMRRRSKAALISRPVGFSIMS